MYLSVHPIRDQSRVNGGTLNASALRVGDGNNGALTLNSGTVNQAGTAIGYNTGSSGAVNMTGGTYNANGWFGVGRLGNGSFTQSGGTFTTTDDGGGGVWTGEAAGVTGTITHSGTAVANYTGDRLFDGQATSLYLGRVNDTHGVMTVTDDAVVTIDDRFAMSGGGASTSSLTLSGSGQVTIDRGHVGYNGVASVTASGDSSFNTTGTFFVFGEFADGDGTFSDNAQLNMAANTFVVGVDTGAAGSSLTLNNNAAVTHAGGNFIVARRNDATATVSVNDAATINTLGNMTLGEAGNAAGTVNQSGATSEVDIEGTLSISANSAYNLSGGDLHVTTAINGADQLNITGGTIGAGANDTIATVDVTGNLTLVAAATLEAVATDISTLDQINMTAGTFDAGGATLDFTNNGPIVDLLLPGEDAASHAGYDIVLGTATGNFGNVTAMTAAQLAAYGLTGSQDIYTDASGQEYWVNYNASIRLVPIPEPSSMMLIALAGLGVLRRRR